MYLYRFQAVLGHNIGCGTPGAFVLHLALSDKGKGKMGQLHQVAACAHAAVTRYERDDVAVKKLGEQLHHFRMDAGTALQEGADAGQDCHTHLVAVQRLSGPAGMAADDVVLKRLEVFVLYTPLSHRTETGIYAVNDLVGRKRFQKFVAAPYAKHIVFRWGKAPFPFQNVCRLCYCDSAHSAVK